MSATFFFIDPNTPTTLQLRKHLLLRGYTAAADARGAQFTDQNLILPKACEQLEFKHYFARLAAQYFPQFVPMTVTLDGSRLDYTMHRLFSHEVPWWILKPALMNNGQGIKIFSDFCDLEQHFLQAKGYDGPHVLQQYLNSPHLLNGHKYSFRYFVIFTNYKGVYLYPDGYFNVAKKAYDAKNHEQISGHLTNEHLLQGGDANVWQIPTTRCPNFSKIQPRLFYCIERVVMAIQEALPNIFVKGAIDQFSIFGFDLMLDADLRPWLLEINHGPCFPSDSAHPLQQHLYQPFWQTMMDFFVEPIISDRTVLSPDSYSLIRLQ